MLDPYVQISTKKGSMKMDLTPQTVSLIRDYTKTLVNAGVINQKELAETICRLKSDQTKNLPQKTKEERLISKKEFAKILGYKSPRTIDRMEKKGLFERVHNGIGQVRFKMSDAEKYMGVL
jgi:hypothetical protein